MIIQFYSIISGNSNNNLYYDLFENYPLGQVMVATTAEKWPGNNPWIIQSLSTGIQGIEDFEFYNTNDTLNNLNNQNGLTFNTAWFSSELSTGIKDSDNFEDYSTSSSLNGLNSGTGWNGAWISESL